MDVVTELAEWLEVQAFCPVSTVYTIVAADPSAAEPLTVTALGTGGDQPYLPGDYLGRLQLMARGSGAVEALVACYNGLDGVSVELPSAWVTLVGLQSLPAVLGSEDSGGVAASINFTLDVTPKE